MNSCRAIRCTACCQQTNMLLTPADIARIEALGYPTSFFLQRRPLGLQLKNSQGHCVFLKAGQCSIYEQRPQGCTLYPAVYSKTTGEAILDDTCPRHRDFPLTTETRRQLRRLIDTLFPDGF